MELEAFGELHASKQQYDCVVEDFKGLIQLTKGAPFRNWTNDPESISVDDFTTWFPRDEKRVAIYGDRDEKGMTYAELHDKMAMCPDYDQVTTVALLMPLDLRAEAAVVLASLLSKPLVTVAPLDFMMPLGKMQEAFKQLQCNAIVTTAELYERLMDQQQETAVHEMDSIRLIEPSIESWSSFQWKIIRSVGSGKQGNTFESLLASLPEDHPRILVRTSGSTGNPKVVPLPASQMIHAAAGLAYGLRLSSDDVCICTMPLFHTGGIAGALLCVLVSGSSVVMMKGSFDAQVFLDRLDHSKWRKSAPTWSCLVPTMIKALTLTAQSFFDEPSVNNRLRMIRSTTAHLPHGSAMEFSKTFNAQVYPTMGMSECLPITIPDPIVWDRQPKVTNTVGLPAACSIHVVDDKGEAVPYGQLGEISVGGPGAINSYVGIRTELSHTSRGLLKTGDIGCLDKEGHLFIKGRSKELIKRGGEQVWPSEIDRVIGNMDGVEMAVAFSVPNELWGEEVAVAVVLHSSGVLNEAEMKSRILETSRQQLDHFAVPSQIIFLESKNKLPRAGMKVVRSKIASSLGVTSSDTSALRAFKVGSLSVGNASSSTLQSNAEARPAKALNGVRCIAAYFVVQTHLCHFDSKAMIKLQSFSMNMHIFFFLLAFQMACDVQPGILRRWGSFVGSKIGSMHALFLIARILGVPAMIYWNPHSVQSVGSRIAAQAKAALDSNAFWKLEGPLSQVWGIWFQRAAYQFIAAFPLLNARIQERSDRELFYLLALSATASVVVPGFLFEILDQDYLQFSIWSWVPHLVASTVAGNLFRRHGPMHSKKTQGRESILFDAKFWGKTTDALSILFLALVVFVGWFSSDCLFVDEGTYNLMRPDDDEEEYDEDMDVRDGIDVVWACDVTMDEFNQFVRSNEESVVSFGRWENDIIYYMWVFRLASPLVLMWLYGLAHDRGLTARVMSNQVLQFLAKLGYGVYLLHIHIARYYWFITRGFDYQYWWKVAAEFPFPIGYLELWYILIISGLSTYMLDQFVVPHLVPYTIKGWILAMQAVEWWWNPSVFKQAKVGGSSVFDQVKSIVEEISGFEVSQSTGIDSMGLDSLGASAFVGLLRQRVPAAKALSVSQMTSDFETVGDLVTFLSSQHERKVKKQ